MNFQSKACSKCCVEKEVYEFCKDRQKIDGLCSACKECTRNASKRWREENLDRQKEMIKVWIKHNPAKVRKYYTYYRARIKKATPSWADQDAIKSFYKQAQILTKETGTRYSVDHVIPLNGQNVCGLNVESNIRVIPLQDNHVKGRKFAGVS